MCVDDSNGAWDEQTTKPDLLSADERESLDVLARLGALEFEVRELRKDNAVALNYVREIAKKLGVTLP